MFNFFQLFCTKRYSKSSLAADYFALIFILLLVITSISGFFYYSSYNRYALDKKTTLCNSTKIVERELVNIFEENESILQFFGKKISNAFPNDSMDLIAKLLISTGEFKIKSMTNSYISWADRNGKITFNGKSGLLEEKDRPLITTREYYIPATQKPWHLHTSIPDKSLFGTLLVLPTVMGIEKNGQIVGYLVLGLWIDRIIDKINAALNIKNVDFMIVDFQGRYILGSQNIGANNITTFVNYNSIKNNSSGILQKPLTIANTMYENFTIIPDYKYIVLTGFIGNSFYNDFNLFVLPKIYEFFFIGTFSCLLLLFLKKRVITPISKLSNAASLIAKGKTKVFIPRGGAIEIRNLAKSLLLVIRYINRTKRYKNKLEITHTISENSDKAKESFIKEINSDLAIKVNGIKIFTDILLNYGVDKLSLSTIEHSIEKIYDYTTSIINNLPVTLKLDWYNINTIVLDAIAINQKAAHIKEISILSNLDHNIAELYLDKLRIKQIMVSIIAKSIANSPNKETISIVTSQLDSGNIAQTIITIDDHGFGLSEEKLTQINNAANINENLLSPSIINFKFIKKIISMHNGNIFLSNKLGAGTKIKIVFPAINKIENVVTNNIVSIKKDLVK